MLTTSWRVRAEDFQQDWFAHRRLELHEPFRLHRKLWEFAVIAQLYHEQLGMGGHVLGFGVGQEPLPAWFASRGASVLASDQAPEHAGPWAETGQHAFGLGALRRPAICADDTLAAQVGLAYVDMTELPEPLRRGRYDLTWSSCAFEHLGSIGAGLRFFCQQMACLRPGGVAVHTTELNVSPTTETLDDGGTVLYRCDDLLELAARLSHQGDQLWPLDLYPGSAEADCYVDQPPYQDSPHLCLQIGRFVSTSVALIATRGGA